MFWSSRANLIIIIVLIYALKKKEKHNNKSVSFFDRVNF